jgi:hypothetical protein
MVLLDYHALAVSIRATRLRCASVLAKRTDRRWHHPQIQLQFTLQPACERRAREDVIGVRGLSVEDIHERGIEIGESESRLNFGGISIEEGP